MCGFTLVRSVILSACLLEHHSRQFESFYPNLSGLIAYPVAFPLGGSMQGRHPTWYRAAPFFLVAV